MENGADGVFWEGVVDLGDQRLHQGGWLLGGTQQVPLGTPLAVPEEELPQDSTGGFTHLQTSVASDTLFLRR